MKKIITIIGTIFVLIGVVISVTPLYKLSLIPTAGAIICLGALISIKKKTGSGTKFIQYIGILSAIATSLVIYKINFTKNQVENVDELEEREDKSVEDSIELLEAIDVDE